jgi:hypothetical protein
MLLYLSSIIICMYVCMYYVMHVQTPNMYPVYCARVFYCASSHFSLYSKNFFRSSFKCNSKQLSKAKSKATLLRFC